MNLQLIRNATMKIHYAGATFLTDPMLAPRHALEAGEGVHDNPTKDLPLPLEEILAGVDYLLVSHSHRDHFDLTAQKSLPKSLPLLCQPPDVATMRDAGFKEILPVDGAITKKQITITRTGGCHGTTGDNYRMEDIVAQLGPVSGFVLQAESEPTVYWVGDSVWCEEVRETIEQFDPDIIITHSGGAFPDADLGPIIMDAPQTITTAQTAPRATVVAVHLEALTFCPETRKSLRQLAEHSAIPAARLLIPADGETLQF